MAISETITVDAEGAIAQLDAFAAAAEEAAAKYDAAFGKLKTPSIAGGAGADKLAASMSAAADRIAAAADKAAASMGRIGAAADAAAGGVGRLDEAASTAGGSLGEAAAGLMMRRRRVTGWPRPLMRRAAALDRQAVAGERAGKSNAKAAESGAAGWMKAGKVAAVSIAVAAAYGIDKAMKLQTEVTRLYTAAGLQGVKPAVTRRRRSWRSAPRRGSPGRPSRRRCTTRCRRAWTGRRRKGLTEQSANLANIHGANLEDTTYAMSSVMKAYNMGAKQVTPTAALLNSIVGQGDMRFQDFNESVKNFAPTGASMGISLQSMGAGLAYLTDRGNSAEVASTRLTMGLSMATAGSKAANTYMKDLGLTTGNLDLKNKSLQATMEKGGLTTNKFAADLKKPDGLYTALKDMQGAFHKAGRQLSAG